MFIAALLIIAENWKQPLTEMPHSSPQWMFSFVATSNKPTLFKTISVLSLIFAWKVFTQMEFLPMIQLKYSLSWTKVLNSIICTSETPYISSYSKCLPTHGS